MLHNIQSEALGTDVVFAVAAPNVDESSLNQVFAQARASVHRDEVAWSRFLPHSVISRIAQSAGQWLEIDNPTFDLLTLALAAYERTNGLFHPGLGHTMEALGYDKSFHDGLDTETSVETGASLTVQDGAPFYLDASRRAVRIEPGITLDLGGIAKGYIVERAAAVMRDAGYANAVCSAGGDMMCHGSNEGVAWTVGIDNPFDPASPIVVSLVDASLATSGTYKRVWRRGEEKMHHIVDPRTGRSAKTDVVSCTVSVARLVDAEVLAKVCLLLGTEHGIPWLRQQGCRNYVIIDTRGEVIKSWKS